MIEAAAAQTEIHEMVSRIVDQFEPERVILFGSYARGDAGPDSDVDLLVLFRHVEEPGKKAGEMYAALSHSRLPKDIIVSTTGQFEQYRDVVNTVYWPAAREGRVLYERAA